jgi:hypothetical protein
MSVYPKIISPFFMQETREVSNGRLPRRTWPVSRGDDGSGTFIAAPFSGVDDMSVKQVSSEAIYHVGGLGGFEIPWQCWDTAGFKAAHGACWDAATAKCGSDAACVNEEVSICAAKLVSGMCNPATLQQKQPSTIAATTAAGACTSADIIKAVQAAIGATADGKWGPKSQAALDAKGGNFKLFAPNCAGNVPKYSAVKGTTTAPPQPVITNVSGGKTYTAAPPAQAGLMQNPIFWVGVAAVGIFGLVQMKKKQGK